MNNAYYKEMYLVSKEEYSILKEKQEHVMTPEQNLTSTLHNISDDKLPPDVISKLQSDALTKYIHNKAMPVENIEIKAKNEDVIEDIINTLSDRAKNIFKFIQQHKHIFDYNRTGGEIIIRGHAIEYSNIINIIEYMSMDQSRRDFLRPFGLDNFLDELKHLNYPLPIFGRLGIAEISNKRKKPRGGKKKKTETNTVPYFTY